MDLTIEGCPASCSNHGQCRVSGEGLWECRCYDGWDGIDCSVALEQNCLDNIDNDKGMILSLESQATFKAQLQFIAILSHQMVWSTAKTLNVVLIMHVVRVNYVSLLQNPLMSY